MYSSRTWKLNIYRSIDLFWICRWWWRFGYSYYNSPGEDQWWTASSKYSKRYYIAAVTLFQRQSSEMLSPLKKREVEFKSPFTPKVWLTTNLGSIFFNLLGLFTIILHPFLHFSKTWSWKEVQKKFKSHLHKCVFAAVNHLQSQTSDLETQKCKTDQNPPIKKINYKPWLFEGVEENFCFLRGPLRWLMAAKNANVSWLLNFRICVFLKSADLKKKSPKAKMQLKTKIEFVSIWFCQMGH